MMRLGKIAIMAAENLLIQKRLLSQYLKKSEFLIQLNFHGSLPVKSQRDDMLSLLLGNPLGTLTYLASPPYFDPSRSTLQKLSHPLRGLVSGVSG